MSSATLELEIAPSPFGGYTAGFLGDGYLGEGRTARAALEDVRRHFRWWNTLERASVPRPGEQELEQERLRLLDAAVVVAGG